LAYALNNDLGQKKVLIVEKNPITGGYVTSFSRKGFQFDTCQMASQVSDILDYFGIKIDIREYKDDFIRVFKADTQNGSVRTFELHAGEGTFEEQFIRLFPNDEKKLRKMFTCSLAMFHEIYGLKYAPGFIDIFKMLVTCPRVIRNSNKTFTGYLKMFGIDNPDIDLLFQVFSSMCGLPNHRIAALLTVGVMYSLREKAYRPTGPFIELPQKMEQRFRELGGELLLKTEVEKILVENGEVQGIRLKDGSVIRSKNVISTVDVKTTVKDLVGLDIAHSLKPKYAKKLGTVEMTTSSFTVNLGIDDDRILSEHQLHCGYALLTSGNDAFPRLFSAFQKNESGLSQDCFNIGFSCPYPDVGKNPVLSIQAIPTPVGNWTHLRNSDRAKYIEEKEKIGNLLIDVVEKYLVPGLRRHIVVKDISTPATFVRYSGCPTGSIYDMASVPENFGNNRLPVVTPIHGLLLPKFAHGVFGAMNSGLQAVDILLNGKVMHGNSRFKKSSV
jgi:phytoene dehydrogenase-like protein